VIAKLVRRNALYSSVAAANDHPIFKMIHNEVTNNIGAVIRLGQGHPNVPLRARLGLSEDNLRPLVESWLRLADLGITGFELERSNLTDREARLWEMFKESMNTENDDPEFTEAVQGAFFSKLKLLHGRGAEHPSVVLSFELESAGTQIWMALLIRVIGALTLGRVLMVDEVDSSLHPSLSAGLIQMFKDPVINFRSAQLIFTSHDVSLLGNLIEDEVLGRSEIWFSEKSDDGATTLFPLSDFHPRKGENFERAYLQGRYGAVPYVDISELRKVFAREDAS
jgi:hypothetical protein